MEAKLESCALYCINEKNTYVKISPTANDSTPCKAGTNYMCISGTCRVWNSNFSEQSRLAEKSMLFALKLSSWSDKILQLNTLNSLNFSSNFYRIFLISDILISTLIYIHKYWILNVFSSSYDNFVNIHDFFCVFNSSRFFKHISTNSKFLLTGNYFWIYMFTTQRINMYT